MRKSAIVEDSTFGIDVNFYKKNEVKVDSWSKIEYANEGLKCEGIF